MVIFVTYFFVTGKFDPRQSWMKLKVWKLKTYKRKYMDTQRITSNWIQELKPNEIFVFGNTAGVPLCWHIGSGALSGDKVQACKVRLMVFQQCMAE